MYEILCTTNPGDLAAAVREWMAENPGWKPAGGVCSDENGFYQAVFCEGQREVGD